MKFIHEYEDCIVGLFVGIVIIGLSGMYFRLPTFRTYVWGAVMVASLLFTIFDLRHTFKELKTHRIVLILLLLNNAVDLVLEAGLAAYLFRVNIPYISYYLNPYFAQAQMLFYIGMFFIASSVLWIIESTFKLRKK
jgi:uncharacterized membrane protein HdeD (DUF308 family)